MVYGVDAYGNAWNKALPYGCLPQPSNLEPSGCHPAPTLGLLSATRFGSEVGTSTAVDAS